MGEVSRISPDEFWGAVDSLSAPIRNLKQATDGLDIANLVDVLREAFPRYEDRLCYRIANMAKSVAGCEAMLNQELNYREWIENPGSYLDFILSVWGKRFSESVIRRTIRSVWQKRLNDFYETTAKQLAEDHASLQDVREMRRGVPLKDVAYAAACNISRWENGVYGLEFKKLLRAVAERIDSMNDRFDELETEERAQKAKATAEFEQIQKDLERKNAERRRLQEQERVRLLALEKERREQERRAAEEKKREEAAARKRKQDEIEAARIAKAAEKAAIMANRRDVWTPDGQRFRGVVVAKSAEKADKLDDGQLAVLNGRLIRVHKTRGGKIHHEELAESVRFDQSCRQAEASPIIEQPRKQGNCAKPNVKGEIYLKTEDGVCLATILSKDQFDDRKIVAQLPVGTFVTDDQAGWKRRLVRVLPGNKVRDLGTCRQATPPEKRAYKSRMNAESGDYRQPQSFSGNRWSEASV